MQLAHFPCFNFLKFLIRKYYFYLFIGVVLTLLQILWGYYILYIGIESAEINVYKGNGKKPLLQFSEHYNPLLKKGNNIKNYVEYFVQNYSLHDSVNYENCSIQSIDAIAALKRAKTDECKAKIRILACKTESKNLFAKRVTSKCPSNGNVKGRHLGCFIDNITDRLLTGYKSQLINNHPNLCADICLQRGYIYAGVEYSNECFCGNNELPLQLRVPDDQCQMRCSGDQSNINCGGHLRIDIVNTGLAKVVPNSLLEFSDESGPDVRIAFILTLNGRSLRQIHRLLKTIYNKQHYYFIHIDSRQHYLFTELVKLEKLFSNIILSRNRLSTIWGGASLLTVLLNSMETLLKKDDWHWDFIINLSESDYPIKSVIDLTKFLTANRDKNFLKSHGQNTKSFLKKQGLDRTFLECEERMWRIGQKKFPLGLRVDGGSDWLGLGRKFVQYVVFSQDKLVIEMKKFFSFTLLPAESFFHMVLRNSEMCHTYIDNNLHLTNWNRKLGCRCQYKEIVDWCGCSPNNFVTSDLTKIQASTKRHLYFGRKFEPIKSLDIINKVDLNLYGGIQSAIPAMDTHWENRYHIIDHPSGRSDSELTLYHWAANKSVTAIQNCETSLSDIIEVHTLHIKDSFQGILVKYLTSFENRNITTEAHIIKNSQFIKNNNHPLTSYLQNFQINSNFDMKELMFRNFEEVLGPHHKLTAAIWWHHVTDSNERTNINFNSNLVVIDPLDIVAVNDPILTDKEHQQVSYHHLVSIKYPLRPGIWMAYIINGNKILAQNTFAILPSQFLHGKLLHEEEKSMTASYGSYNVNRKDYDKLIFAEETQKEISQFNAQLFKKKNHNLITDLIAKRMYDLKGICFHDDKLLPSCIKNALKCAKTYWSSLSPDPKTVFG